MLKKIASYVGLFVGLTLCYVGLLTALSSFMTEGIKNNIISSSKTLSEEGNWPERHIFYRGYGINFDSFMDALMLSTVWSVHPERPLRSALLMPHDGLSAAPEKPGELISHDAVTSLEQTINNESVGVEYARYWHGYMIWLKPLLLFTDISGIRIILTIILCLLLIFLLFSLVRAGHKWEAVIIGSGALYCDYVYMGTSLQGVSVFLIMMISSIILWYVNPKWAGYIFFITGSLIAFTDLLTVPLLGLMIPLMIYQIKIASDQSIPYFKTPIINGLLWSAGFIGTMGIKWWITDICCHRHLIKLSLKQFLFRTKGLAVSRGSAIILNLTVIKTFLIPAFLIFIILLIAFRKNITKSRAKASLIYLLCAMSPFVVYGILTSHSWQHYYFTYRNLTAFHIGIFMFLYTLIKKRTTYD